MQPNATITKTPVLDISLIYCIYRIYRRDKGEEDIFYGIYRDISETLNVSRHITKITRVDGIYRLDGKKKEEKCT
jgi:hypothetical protein